MIRCFGTVYRFHPLFVLLMLLSIMTGYFIELLTLFGVVLIHEMGHVVAARGFGWKVREVKLLPFGGVAITDEDGCSPAREELIVALMGPLQNAIMVGFALLMMEFTGADGEWWNYFLRANLLIGAFNLLPIHPLDGGRVLLCLLSYGVSQFKAIAACTRFSLVLSIGMVIAAFIMSGSGLYSNVLLVGLFLLVTNWYGLKHLPYQFLRFLIGREKAIARFLRDGVVIKKLLVSREATLNEITHLFMRNQYHLICIRGEQGIGHTVIPEQVFLQVFWGGGKTDRAVSEVFM